MRYCELCSVLFIICMTVPLLHDMAYREALSFMYNSIERDGLTGLQSVWGGSHDALLGLLVWMYSIPTYAFER